MLPQQKKNKVFCIGSGKTGTTSIGAALRSLGYQLGDQPTAELLIEKWARRDFRPIIEYCNTADAFQDIPFCLDYTYVALDHEFPGSKFILTVRKDASEWYSSLIRFHSKLVGTGQLPTADDLKACTYLQVGWLWRTHELLYGCDASNVYDRERYMRHYESHRDRVIDYFRHRARDLLILNVGDASAMDQLCRFLGVPRNNLTMPHLNSSR
jgi:hypothetical protein